jgi:type II secretory pathway pseudopilin PulG
MNLRADNLHRVAVRQQSAFTMIEIAIALGVIAFALIAIIGILPTGLQTSRDNREETIINQDARLLLEAVKTGGRDLASDIGSYVVTVDGTNYSGNNPPGIPTTNLVKLLTDASVGHKIIFSAISGAVVNRGSDFAFRYQVTNTVRVAEGYDTTNSPLFNQVFEVGLRFAWPITAAGTLGSEANRYVVRTLVSGIYTNGFFYAQQYEHVNIP